MITLKWWEFALLMLLSGIVSAAVSDVVHAGTTMQNLKESTEIVDMDKWLKERDKALEYERKQGAMVFTSSITIKEMK